MKKFLTFLLIGNILACFAMDEEDARVSSRLQYKAERDQFLIKRRTLVDIYGPNKARSATEQMKEEAFHGRKAGISGRKAYDIAEAKQWGVLSIPPFLLSLISGFCADPRRLYAYFVNEQCVESEIPLLVNATCCCCTAALVAAGCSGIYIMCSYCNKIRIAQQELSEFDRIEQIKNLGN
jgi:hypothetical protein